MANHVQCPAGCGKKFISQAHAETHADNAHDNWRDPQPVKRKGWATPHGFIDFSHPVTYQEACDQMQTYAVEFWKNHEKEKDQ